jgi:CBS-domain-containing membrane protein
MTKGVISIKPQATIVQAIKLMLKNRISGLPVIDQNEKLVGIITEGDFLHRHEIGTEPRRNAWLDARLCTIARDQSGGTDDPPANHSQ